MPGDDPDLKRALVEIDAQLARDERITRWIMTFTVILVALALVTMACLFLRP